MALTPTGDAVLLRHAPVAGVQNDPILLGSAEAPGIPQAIAFLLNPLRSAALARLTRHHTEAEFVSKQLATLFPEINAGDEVSAARLLSLGVHSQQEEPFRLTNNNLAPRLSIGWDPFSDGRTKVFATWGRYYDKLFLSTIVGEEGPDTINRYYLLDADGVLWRIWHPSGFNGKYWSENQPGRRFHDIMEQARYTMDQKKRKELYTEATRIMHEAIDGGLTFFDNAWDYHDGGSEEVMGEALATDGKRKKCFLMTKNCARDAKGTRQHLEDSLRRLKTDVIDLWQFHEINYDNDPEWIVERGALAEALRAQKEGKIRFIGFTGHKSPDIHLSMLPRHTWHTVQMPVNVCDWHYRSFIRRVIPEAEKRQIAVIGMKSLGGGANNSVDQAVRNSADSGVTYSIAAGNSGAGSLGRVIAVSPLIRTLCRV